VSQRFSIAPMTRVIPAMAGLLVLAACTAGEGTIRTFQPPAGANEMLHGPIEAAPGHSLTMGDLVFAPDTQIARHFHAGEEFLYVMGGSIIISRVDEQDVTVAAGQGLRIPPNTVHWGRAGPDGARGVASWVRVDGQPLRTPVPN
jgi:quercetin dioxygenase-like cupin family protein